MCFFFAPYLYKKLLTYAAAYWASSKYCMLRMSAARKPQLHACHIIIDVAAVAAAFRNIYNKNSTAIIKSLKKGKNPHVAKI